MMQNSVLKVRKLDNFGQGFTCKWKGRCDPSKSLESVPPKPISPESTIPNFVPIEKITDIKENMKICIKNQATGKVLKVQENSQLEQANSANCEDATIYVFKIDKIFTLYAFVQLYNPETEKYLIHEKWSGNQFKIFETDKDIHRVQPFVISDNRINRETKQYFFLKKIKCSLISLKKANIKIILF